MNTFYIETNYLSAADVIFDYADELISTEEIDFKNKVDNYMDSVIDIDISEYFLGHELWNIYE